MNTNLSKKQKVGVIVFIAILIGISSFIYFTNSRNTKDDEIHTNRTLVENKESEEKTNNKKQEININEIKMIKAYICGYVVSPGVYEVSNGDRLNDLVNRAGGFTKEANPREINLAVEIKDQGYYRIPGLKEITTSNISNDASLKESTSSSSASQEGSFKGSKININTADKESLKELPRVGDAISQRIIDYREKEGKFKDIEDIKEVSGIGDKMFESIKDKISVE